VFAIYFVILAAIGHLHDWLLFLVVPAGLGGVSVGALLDRAHDSRKPSSAGLLSEEDVEAKAPGEPSADGGDSTAEEAQVAEQTDDGDLAGAGQQEPETEA
jgi:hypothetical protein